MSEENKILKHWEIKKLSDLIGDEGVFCDGDWVETKDQDKNGDVRLIQLADIGDGCFRDKSDRYLTLQRAKELKCTFLEKDDILIARMPDPLGRCCVFPLKGENKYVTVVDVAIIRTNENICNKKFLSHIINSLQIRKAINDLESGTTRKRISRKNLNTINFPIPPLSEQQAIISKIEELFSDLENGKQQLQTAGQQLRIYRQSMFKWAFEGKLTNENVIDGELPRDWKWVKLGDVCNKIGDIDHKMPKQTPSGYPYVSTKDFTDDLKISFDNAKYISEEDFFNLSRKIKPERGDIIFPRYGTIGKNILIDFDKDFLVSYSCAVIKPNPKLVLSKYVYLYSLSPKVTEEIRRYTVETTQANVGIASIKSFVFPLPSLEEQQRIVEELESKLTVCDRIEETINQSLQQAETLRHSILKKAFEGKLI